MRDAPVPMKMKATIQTLILFFLFAISLSCETSEPVALAPGSVKFGWTEKEFSGGRAKDGNDPKSILISIKNAEGEWVYQLKKLTLFKFGQEFISENLQLMVGSYQLVEFLVLDEDDNIIYATPVQGSELAASVDHPLPVDFEITESGNTPLILQVLPVTTEDDPESFGYVTFGFEIVGESKSSQLKEIWIDDGSEPVYRTTYKMYLNYSENRLVSMVTFGQFGSEDNWELMDSMILTYTSEGKLSAKLLHSLELPATNDIKYTYQYNQDGRLHQMTRSGGLGGTIQLKYTYDQNGHIESAAESGFGNGNYEYEFVTDSDGNVLKQQKFITGGFGKKLQWAITSTYDQSLRDPSITLIGLLNFDNFRHDAFFGKNNIASYRTSHYSNGSIEHFLCENVIEYLMDDNNNVSMALFSDAEHCVNGTNNNFEDGTRFTFIYN
jgi:hypothetical protein